MRHFHLAALTCLCLCSAGATSAQPKLGQRTAAPSQIAPATPDPEAEMRDAIAAAEAFPLGSLKNPVRAAGPEGERAYLARLRCGNGASPGIIPMGSGGIGAYGSLVDIFILDCGSAAPGRLNLAMDKYQEEHAETRAPAGFSLVAP